MGQQELATKVRLFVSAVMPANVQVGALVVGVTLSVSVWTTIDEPLLKLYWEPPPLPTILNSAVFQWAFRFTRLLFM
jgi:hypothetical protein